MFYIAMTLILLLIGLWVWVDNHRSDILKKINKSEVKYEK